MQVLISWISVKGILFSAGCFKLLAEGKSANSIAVFVLDIKIEKDILKISNMAGPYCKVTATIKHKIITDSSPSRAIIRERRKMFNAEKLLGKIISETLGGSGSGKGRGGLMDSLASGTGLMTAIGLGVGAYEILKEQKGKAVPPPPAPGSVPPGVSAPPPLPPSTGGRKTQPPPPPPTSTGGVSDGNMVNRESEDVALRMIRVMIAAAHADGVLDANEEKAILDRLRGAEFTDEEKMFLLDELHKPKSVAELTAGIDDPSSAKALYMIGVAAIEVDTEAEQAWLDDLGSHLGLSSEIRKFIEEQSGK